MISEIRNKRIFECFGKKITLNLPLGNSSENSRIIFWVERFCPNVKEVEDLNTSNFMVDCIIDSKNEILNRDENHIVLKGTWNGKYAAYLGKFLAQIFQKLLIYDRIFIIPASCIIYQDKAILLMGDFWQGKTSVALQINKKNKLIEVGSDNYVAIKDNKIIGLSKYLSLRKENVLGLNNINKDKKVELNSRYFFEHNYINDCNFKLKAIIIPLINEGDDNKHIISKEESIWYLYQKFSRLMNGECVLFDGKLPSPIFNDSFYSNEILKAVNNLLENCSLHYLSSSIDNIFYYIQNIFTGGEK